MIVRYQIFRSYFLLHIKIIIIKAMKLKIVQLLGKLMVISALLFPIFMRIGPIKLGMEKREMQLWLRMNYEKIDWIIRDPQWVIFYTRQLIMNLNKIIMANNVIDIMICVMIFLKKRWGQFIFLTKTISLLFLLNMGFSGRMTPLPVQEYLFG